MESDWFGLQECMIRMQEHRTDSRTQTQPLEPVAAAHFRAEIAVGSPKVLARHRRENLMNHLRYLERVGGSSRFQNKKAESGVSSEPMESLF